MNTQSSIPDWARSLLKQADIEVNGSRPWDITVHNNEVFPRIGHEGSLGLGESYMEGWWDVPQLDQFFEKILSAQVEKKIRLTWPQLFNVAKASLLNLQTSRRAFVVGEKHYDVGNDLYQAMLDSRLTYTCGYWKQAKNLEEAQEAKLDLVCRKIGLRKGQRVLDIGCGWGSFAKFAAEKYGAEVVGVTISKEQVELGRKLCEGLPVEIRLQDYRDINEKFDHIISLGMFEHVGSKNYHSYMEVAHRCLQDDGLFLLHTIGTQQAAHGNDPWIEKYIFPNSILPSGDQIVSASEPFFVMEDWHNFGAYYDKTLMAWFSNFDRAWPTLQASYSPTFYRMWKYYLLSCAAAFRTRHIHLWQIVFSKHGVPGGYQSIR